jgi:hypothetical protein
MAQPHSITSRRERRNHIRSINAAIPCFRETIPSLFDDIAAVFVSGWMALDLKAKLENVKYTQMVGRMEREQLDKQEISVRCSRTQHIYCGQ